MKTLEKREARLRMTAELVTLLQMQPEQRACWTGSVADLLEAVHVAYESCTIREEDGRLTTFTQLAERTCRSLHIRTPRNPRQTAYQARNRKGTRQTCYFERYCRMMFDMNIEMPMQQCVRMEDGEI